MRAVLALVLVAACSSLAPTYNGGGGGGGGVGSGSDTIAECSQDKDCALAGPTCCACPTFAVSASDPTVQACNQVGCPAPGPSCPGNARAACINNTCQLACVAMACTNTCSDGFEIDANGCLTCTCAVVTSRGCTADTDCVRTRADCCGCAHGGSDTAVPGSDQAAFDQSLMCPSDPQCPSVDTCAAGLEPRCIEGAGALATATPAGACGTPTTATCAPSQQCYVNVDPDADQQGVGVCM